MNTTLGRPVFWALFISLFFNYNRSARTNTSPISGDWAVAATVPVEKQNLESHIKILSTNDRGIIIQGYGYKLPSSIVGLSKEHSTRQGTGFNTPSIISAININENANMGVGNSSPNLNPHKMSFPKRRMKTEFNLVK